MSRQPLYPHIPKRRKPLYPHRDRRVTWLKGERAICVESDSLSDVYIVEFSRDINASEIACPVKIIDVLSSTREDIKVGHLFIAAWSTLFRDFKEFAKNDSTRLRWLRSKGIPLEATAYNYQPWDTGDVAWYIDPLKSLIAGVRILSLGGICRVEVIKTIYGDIKDEFITVPKDHLYRNFRDYATQHPERAEWIVGLWESGSVLPLEDME